MDKEVTMPAETLNKVVGYLRSCPYGHVAHIINEISITSKTVKTEEKPSEEKEAPQDAAS